MSKRKCDDELEILEKLVKKKQVLLNSSFGCSSCFNKAKNDSKTKKTFSSMPRLLKYKICRRQLDRGIFSSLQCKNMAIIR